MKILHIAGARPNFMKVAPVMAALKSYPNVFEQILVHTGQHYDYEMSQVFFDELELPTPNEYLNVGSGSHAAQTARILLAFEPVLLNQQPEWIFVYGDVNSTLACALAGVKLGIPIAHVEAGLRSFDRSMPEEINRLLTDQVSDLLFTPSQDADQHLLDEGIAATKIHFIGNVMIDSLVKMLPSASMRPVLQNFSLETRKYILVTLHRPANVDQRDSLAAILSALETVAEEIPVIFPVHPRTRERIAQFGLQSRRIRLLEPLGYLDFLALIRSARLVLTDLGGIQEETTFLGVPCLTLRTTTERPVTIQMGSNRLVDCSREAILTAVLEKPLERVGAPQIPLWDGRAAHRIAQVMVGLV